MSANPQKAREIFVAAVKMAPDQWDTFLDEACGAEVELRRRVRSLLSAHCQAGSFLEPAAPNLRDISFSPTAVKPGSFVGPYKLLEQLGEGGFGVVFMAEQTQPVRRLVALKVIKPGMDSDQVIARFEAERQVLALMDHPNIAKVLDAGETTTGRPFFVMELVKGIPITDFCDRHGLGVPERLELFISVCKAMQHAHQKGVIHRDLKPSNVLVTSHDGVPVPKVIDFGIAKATGAPMADKTLFTGFAQMVGTPLYMSPEQIEMSGLDLDTRTDVYALGVLLYEMLTGTTPFAEERLKQAGFDEIRRIIREEEPPRPSVRLSTLGQALDMVSAQRKIDLRRLGRQLRGELDWIVMKCLEKDRTRRYESASALAADVRHHLQDEPISAGPPSARYRFGKFARRHRVALTTASLVVLALVLGTTISTWQAIRATSAEILAEKRREVAEGEEKRATQAELEACQSLFEARLAQARSNRLSPQAGQRFGSWKVLTEAAKLAKKLNLGEDRLREVRDEAIACLALADIKLVKKWDWPTGSSAGLAFDANLERYARSDGKGNVSVRRVDDDRELAVLRCGGPGASNMAFSPDGTLLAIESWQLAPGDPNFQLWDWQRNKCILQPLFTVRAMGFSPDGHSLALGRADKKLTLHDVITGEEGKPINLDFVPRALAFHPDGDKLAVASDHSGDVQVHDMRTGTVRKFCAGKPAWQVAWHPDGVLLAAASDDSNLYIWDAVTGQEHVVLRGHQAGVVRVNFSPDGDTLLSSAWDSTSRMWDVWAGRELVRFPDEARHFSRDGRRLITQASVGPELALWDVALAREYRSLPRSQPTANDEIRDGDISRDGRWLALAGKERLRIWNLALRKEICSLSGLFVIDAKFHPNEEELFTSGRAGVYRWPLSEQGDSLRIGPARKVLASSVLGRISVDRAGRTLAVIDGFRGRVVSLEQASGKGPVVGHPAATTVALSPDQRWFALGTQHGPGVKVCDARTGHLVRSLVPDERDTTVAFSPDSQQFVIGLKSEYQFLDTTSWELTCRIPREGGGLFGVMSFTRDGKVLALLVGPGQVRLVDPATGRSFANLQAPNTEPIHWLGFTPDGSQLLVGSGMYGHVHVWDLRLVGRQLRDLGLDWNLPLAAESPPVDAKPMKVELKLGDHEVGLRVYEQLVGGYGHYKAKRWSEAAAACSQAIELQPDHACAWEMRGQVYQRLGQWDKAIADASKAVELAEGDPRLLNNLAWMLVTCPESHQDVSRALRLAERAVQLTPEQGVYWNTLGVAHYRAGNWKEVIEALAKSMELRRGGDSFDFFFLAMAHWRLKQHEQARQWYAKAIEWMDKHQPKDEESRRFRSEAAELLEMKEQEK
jgi:serine/threonine protein kinase/WD40 repeat protein/Tfp pilus assembly protein PilF